MTYFLHRGVGRGAGLGRDLGVGEHLPVHGVAVGVGVALTVGVGVGDGPPIAVFPPGVKANEILIASAPDDHFTVTAGPDGGVIDRRLRSVNSAGCRPTVCRGVIAPTAVKKGEPRRSLRPTQSFRCPSRRLCENTWASGASGRGGCCPTIGDGIVSPTGVKVAFFCHHLRPRQSFHSGSRRLCAALAACCRRVGRAGCRPAICRRIVAPTGVEINKGVQITNSAPNNHFALRPDGGVDVSAIGRVGRAGYRPAICRRIVAPTSVNTGANQVDP